MREVACRHDQDRCDQDRCKQRIPHTQHIDAFRCGAGRKRQTGERNQPEGKCAAVESFQAGKRAERAREQRIDIEQQDRERYAQQFDGLVEREHIERKQEANGKQRATLAWRRRNRAACAQGEPDGKCSERAAHGDHRNRVAAVLEGRACEYDSRSVAQGADDDRTVGRGTQCRYAA